MDSQNRNTILIIAAIAFVLLCCCCLLLVVAWYSGDYFVNALNDMGSLTPALFALL